MTEGAVFEAFTNYRASVDNRAGYTSEGLITSIVRNKRNPDWVCDLPVGDASYPQVLNGALQITGNTGAASTGTAHTHANNFTSFAGAAYWTVGQNASLGVYVRATDTYQVDRFSWFAYISSGGAMAGGTIDFECFRENDDLSLTRILSGPVSVGGSMSTTVGTKMNVTLSDTLTVREGERYMLRLANRSSPARTIAILGLGGAASAAELTGALPFATNGATDTNRTTHSTAQAAAGNAATAVIAWFRMGRVSPPAEDRTYRDNFDRVNLGPAWSTNQVGVTAPMIITNNRLAYNGTTNGIQMAMLIYPAASDAQRIDIDVYDISSLTAGVGILMHLQRETGSALAVNIFSNGTTIVSYPTGAGSGIQRGVVFMDNTSPATWSVYYVPATKTYTVLKDNQDIGLSWADSTDIIPHDINRRYAGIEIARDGGVNGGTVDNFVFRDWTP